VTTPRLLLAEPPDSSIPIAPELRETFRVLDAVAAGFIVVLSFTTATPPATPSQGDSYLVPASATGAWLGHQNHLAIFTPVGWIFRTPRFGWIAVIADENVPYGRVLQYSGLQWTGWILSADHILLDAGDYFAAQTLQKAMEDANARIQANEAELVNHEGRIIALEASGGGGGGPITPNCSFTVTALSSLLTTNLTTEGTIDWLVPNGITNANWDYSSLAQTGRKAAGGFITRLATNHNGSGGWTGTFSASSNNWQGSYSAGDSANDATSGTYSGAQFISCGVGQGFVMVVPAGQRTRYLRLYVSNATPYRIDCKMSDGNSFSVTGITDVNAQILIQYNASREGHEMNVQCLKETSSGNIGFMGATLGFA
jgi:hypothetical protein